MHRFKDLDIWKKSREFCSKIYNVTTSFPDVEKFGLVNQLQRVFVSVPSNIAEGSSRHSNKDFSRFLELAIGSCYEIETQLLIASDLKFISEKELNNMSQELNEIIKMISKFKSTLKQNTTI